MTIWLLFLAATAFGEDYISTLHHVTYSDEALRRYATASTLNTSFPFIVAYNDIELRLRLYPPHHKESLSTPFLASNTQHSLLTGFVEGEAMSEVYGHFTPGGIFSGVVYTTAEIIHIEPSQRFGVNTSHNVVYHRSDVNYAATFQHFKGATPGDPARHQGDPARHQDVFSPAEPHVPFRHDSPISYSKRSVSGRKLPNKKKTCPVYLVSDHLFYKEMGMGDEDTTKNELILHLHEADKIFRSTDFNNDGQNDDIGFSVANIAILKENTAENKFSDGVIGVKEFLDRWSEYDHDDYCLAVLFTYRDFDSGVLGLAWVASVDGAPGGVCQRRQLVGDHNRNLNTAIVSLINFGRYVGHAVSFITVAHELGHNFGSSHDEESYSCSPGIQGGGNYIMYARATDGNLPNNVKFSRCSKDAITRVLSVKSTACFKQEKSFCGNKIKEWDEVCDCGNADTCNDVDHCCAATTETHPGCVLKTWERENVNFYKCSPQQGNCCERTDCSFKAKSVKCQDEEACKHSSYCDGLSGVCPAARFKVGDLCNEGANTCLEGECKGSVCQRHLLEECQCIKENLCAVCCSENGICKPTLTGNTTKLTYLVSGKSCNNYQGYCNSNHECIQVNLENPLTTLEDIFSKKNLGNAWQWLKTHWYYTLTIVGCTFLLCFLLKVTYRRSAPMQKYMQHISQTLRRVSRPNNQYQHQQLLQTDEDHDKLARMCAMFPTASRSVTWDVRREASNEEAAVIAMLNLGYPFKPNSL